MRYTYTALDKTGKRVSGGIDATSLAAAQSTLKNRSIRVLEVKAEKRGGLGNISLVVQK